MRITITETYDVMRARAVRTGPCPVCGRRTRRSCTFTKTVNPYNRTADGSRPKTYAEVQATVDAQAAAWAPGPEVFTHDACRP